MGPAKVEVKRQVMKQVAILDRCYNIHLETSEKVINYSSC